MNELRDRVKDLLHPIDTARDGVNEYIEVLQKTVLLLAGEIDSIKEDLDWHGVIEGHRRNSAR